MNLHGCALLVSYEHTMVTFGRSAVLVRFSVFILGSVVAGLSLIFSRSHKF